MLREVSLLLEADTDVQQVARKNDAAVTILDCKDLNKKDMAFLIDISSPNQNTEEVISDLKDTGIFNKLYAGESEGPSRSLCVTIRDRPPICQAVLDCGVFCLNCPYSEKQTDEKWRLLVRDSDQLKTLMAKLEGQGIKASIGGLSAVKPRDQLTSRQREVLAKAISLGFFEFPRRLSLTELSEELGIKPSTLSQVLRAAEEKIITKYASTMKISKLPRSLGGNGDGQPLQSGRSLDTNSLGITTISGHENN